MKKLELYEPAMCCSTGICGPSVDENLIRITAIRQELKKSPNIMMVRYNLSQNPHAFVRNTAVTALLQEKGADCLPVTVWDDAIVKACSYPTNEEITRYTSILFDGMATNT